MSEQLATYHIPATDFAVVIGPWEVATERVPSGTVTLPGVGEAVRYRTRMDEAITALREDGYDRVHQLVFSDGVDVVTVARKSRKAKPVGDLAESEAWH